MEYLGQFDHLIDDPWRPSVDKENIILSSQETIFTPFNSSSSNPQSMFFNISPEGFPDRSVVILREKLKTLNKRINRLSFYLQEIDTFYF